MHTQCPFESSSRRPLNSAASRLITATLAVVAICLMSFNSAQAQEPNNKRTNCDSASAQEVATPDPLTPQTQANPAFGGRPIFYSDGGFMYGMINNLVSSAYSYIVPTAAITDPQGTLEDESATAQPGTPTGPCRIASASTGTQR
jgi:hypothetical protein